MNIEVSVTKEKLMCCPSPLANKELQVGALVEFTGIVRGEEMGVSISQLNYELYESMSLSEMRRILTELGMLYPCQQVTVCHRYGFIPVGEAAIYIAVFSKHRREAFALLMEFMDRLKLEVPIWKMEPLPC